MSIKGVKRLHTLTGHKDCIYTITNGKGFEDLCSAGGDGMVGRWNRNTPETGELVAKLPNSIYALLYLQEEDQLIAAQNFEGIHLLDYT
ncbi:MAG: WD40 repeat domain-containing protein, partial [Cyclobacteriaceae bacterium]